MNDNSESDHASDDGSRPTDRSADDSRIEEFLERLAETDHSSVESTDPPSDDASYDDPSLEGSSFGSASFGDDAAPGADSSPGEARSDDAAGGDRLWNSFSADRTAVGEQSGTTTQRVSSSPTEGSTTDWPDGHADPSVEPTAPTEGSAGFAADDVHADGPADTDPSTDSNEGSSSFTTILKRISHRISRATSTDSSTAASTDTTSTTNAGDSAVAETSSTDPAAAESTDHVVPGPNEPASTASPTGNDSTVSSPTASDPIDRILNNIDVFGRATSSSQVLLLSPTAHSITNDIYGRFLLPADGSGQNVLFVSATQAEADQLAAARNVPSWREGKTAVIEVGRGRLKPTAPEAGPDPTQQLDIYKRISNLQHLAKLGINISHIVSQWSDNRRPTVVGVHTLSSIQQYVGNETMFQFLFTLKGQLNSMGVMGFYHMDPAAHTDNEISTIESAFDLVITVSPDGTVDIE